MGTSLTDLFRAETEFAVKASEMYAVMKEAAKAEFLLNAATCEVPHTYARQMATGIKEDAPTPQTPVSVNIDLSSGKDSSGAAGADDGAAGQAERAENDAPAAGRTFGSGSVGIVRRNEQRVEWIDIQDIIRKGRAGVSLPPGTEINFTLKNGDPAQVVIVGVDHYQKGDAVFWFRRIVGRHCMNRNGSNKGGFSGAEDMREYLEEIYSLLPDELQNVIALHKTVQKIDGETVECEDRLFLMTEFEGRGDTIYSEYNGVGKQFPFFKEHRNRIAYDADGDPVYYWTADPSAANTTDFCYFNSIGGSNHANASDEGGVAPLFVIE